MYEETADSCLPARSCQEPNPMYEETDNSLSEGELESTWPFFLFEIVRDRRVQYSVQLTRPPHTELSQCSIY